MNERASMAFFQLSCSAVGIFLLWRLGLKLISRNTSRLPSGPPGIPLLGNLLQISLKGLQYQFTTWAREYGDIYSLKFGPTIAIVLNDPSAIHEIFEKNSAVASDRPPMHIADTVTGPSHNMACARYSDTWRSLRRGAHEILTPQACQRNLPIQQAEALQLSFELLTDPEMFSQSIRRYGHSVITSVLYGRRVPLASKAVPYFKMLSDWTSLITPGTYPPVDMIPILKYVPERFARWKTVCKEVRFEQRKLYFDSLTEVELRISRGQENGSFMETVCKRAGELELSRELIGYLGGVLVEGGSESTAAFIQTLILLLVANPEIQKKAQSEIDGVVGAFRTPIFDDIKELPYVQAIIYETHRYRPIAPLGGARFTMGDVNYHQYVIPKGSLIFPNHWGIFHDERFFEDPEKYNPDRFILYPEKKDIIELVFGSGRRACPGVHLAKASIAIETLHILWGFDLKKARNKEGVEIEPDIWAYGKDSALSVPAPFKCSIKPRTPQHADIIRQDFRASSEFSLPFEQDLDDEEIAYVRELREMASQPFSKSET